MAKRQFASDDTSIWVERYGNGSDGVTAINTSIDATANTTASVTSGSTSLTAGSGTGFAAGNLILIHQSRNGGAGAGAWELNKIASVGGGTNWTLSYATTQAYDTTAQVYLLKQYSSVTINSGQTLTASAWDGTKGGIVAFLSNGDVTVTGNIVATGKGFRGAASAHHAQPNQGEGSAGGGGAGTSANGNGGGSGGASGIIGAGGGGANGGAGTGGQGGGQPGSGGSTVGDTALTVIVLGGGGGGSATDLGTQTGSTASGNGGGIVIIIAKSITVTGTIVDSGAAAVGEQGENSTVRKVTGSGGGGGSILVKGQSVNLGSSLVTASGATQLTASGSEPFSGGAGGTGRIHADYARSITATTTPTIDSTQDNILFDNQGIFSQDI